MDKIKNTESRVSFSILLSLLFLLGCLGTTALRADDDSAGEAKTDTEQPEEDERATDRPVTTGLIGGNTSDPDVLLDQIMNSRVVNRESLFGRAPITPLHKVTERWSNDFYDKTNIRVGTSIHHLFTWLTDEIPGEDDFGTATDVDFITRWDIPNLGETTRSSLTFHLEGRWDWGTTGPMTIGTPSLGMLGSVGNSFARYTPVAIIRNLYWRTENTDKKGAFRIGKITPDGIYGTTRHLTPNNACLSFPCTGAFVVGVPDSGIGFTGAWQFNDRFKIIGGINDANANRFDFGDVGKGKFFKAIDFNVKIAPVTEKAGFSRFLLWQVDEAGGSNGATGAKGWGYLVLLEQELSRDGSLVGIAKYGRSMKGSAAYERQAAIALVKYEPDWISRVNNDSVGASFSIFRAIVDGAQMERNLELWYRFPVTPDTQASLHYQGIFKPSLRFDKDYASAWSIRFTTSF